MTAQQINVAIAEACGYLKRVDFMDGKGPVLARTILASSYSSEVTVPSIVCPNYYASLDACAEMEAGLTLQQCLEYTARLGRMENQDISSTQFAPRFSWHASAAQRTECYLKVLGLWVEQAGDRP